MTMMGEPLSKPSLLEGGLNFIDDRRYSKVKNETCLSAKVPAMQLELNTKPSAIDESLLLPFPILIDRPASPLLFIILVAVGTS